MSPRSKPNLNIAIPEQRKPRWEAYNGDTNDGHVSPLSAPPSPLSRSHASLHRALQTPPPLPTSFNERIQGQQVKRKPQQALEIRESIAFQTNDPSAFQSALGGPEYMPFRRAHTPQPYPQPSQHQRRTHGSQQRGNRTPHPDHFKAAHKPSSQAPGIYKSRSTTSQRKSRVAPQNYSRPSNSSRAPARAARPVAAAGSKSRTPASASTPRAPQSSRLAGRSGGQQVHGEQAYFMGQMAADVEGQGRQKKNKSRGCFSWWYVLAVLICGSGMGLGIGFAVTRSLKRENTDG